jgi:hypothetical protein
MLFVVFFRFRPMLIKNKTLHKPNRTALFVKNPCLYAQNTKQTALRHSGIRVSLSFEAFHAGHFCEKPGVFLHKANHASCEVACESGSLHSLISLHTTVASFDY